MAVGGESPPLPTLTKPRISCAHQHRAASTNTARVSFAKQQTRQSTDTARLSLAHQQHRQNVPSPIHVHTHLKPGWRPIPIPAHGLEATGHHRNPFTVMPSMDHTRLATQCDSWLRTIMPASQPDPTQAFETVCQDGDPFRITFR